MESSTKDQAKGKLQKMKGTVKETVGKLTDNPELEAKGKDEKMTGKVQEGIGKVKKVFGK